MPSHKDRRAPESNDGPRARLLDQLAIEVAKVLLNSHVSTHWCVALVVTALVAAWCYMRGQPRR